MADKISLADFEPNRSELENPYKVLLLDEGASIKDVKRSYRLLAKKLHPDRLPVFLQPDEQKELYQRMVDVNLAYQEIKQRVENRRDGSVWNSIGQYDIVHFDEFSSEISLDGQGNLILDKKARGGYPPSINLEFGRDYDRWFREGFGMYLNVNHMFAYLSRVAGQPIVPKLVSPLLKGYGLEDKIEAEEFAEFLGSAESPKSVIDYFKLRDYLPEDLSGNLKGEIDWFCLDFFEDFFTIPYFILSII